MFFYVHLPPPHPGCRIFHPLHPQSGVPVGSPGCPGCPGSPRTHRRADPTPGTKHWAQEAPAVFLQGNSTAAQANPLIFDGLFYGFLIKPVQHSSTGCWASTCFYSSSSFQPLKPQPPRWDSWRSQHSPCQDFPCRRSR